VQYALGVATLLLVVPVDLATLHQVVAVLLLSAGLIALHSLRGACTYT
jgi:cytochrome c oxidase assembly protein subunit 15